MSTNFVIFGSYLGDLAEIYCKNRCYDSCAKQILVIAQ